ncbi:MAG: SLC13 family permease [Bacillota bacterium]
MVSSGTSLKKGIIPVLFLFIGLVIEVPGLSHKGVMTLGILVFAIIIWSIFPQHQMFTSIITLTLLPLMKIIPFDRAFQSFASSTTWLLTSTFVISEALASTGLDKRLALFLIRLGGKRAKYLLLTTILTALVFVLIIPSAAGRSALIVPICNGLVRALKVNDNGGFNKAVYIGVAYETLIASSITMTGSLSVVFAVGLFASVLDYHWDYLHWLITFAPIAILNTLFLWIILKKLFLSNSPESEKVEIRETEPCNTSPLDREQKRLACYLLLMLGLWVSSTWHGYSTSLVALVTAILIVSPGIGVISMKKAVKSFNFNILLMFAASLSLADSLHVNGVMEWIKQYGTLVNFKVISPLALSAIVMLVIAFLRIAFVTVLSASAALLPLVLAVMSSWGYNPLWGGSVAVISFSLSFLFPTQSATGLITYSTNQLEIWEMLKPGIIYTITVILVTTLFAVYYWPLVGMPIYK